MVCSGSLDDGVIYEQGGEKEMGSGQAWRHGRPAAPWQSGVVVPAPADS